MPTYRAQVVIPMFSGLPTDVITNTWHFDPLPGGTLETSSAAITPLLETFYEGLYITTRPMGNYMRPLDAYVNWYDLSTPPPRTPLTIPLSMTLSVGGTVMPTETAVVLSFQGALVAGGNRARRRGRIYIGALGAGWTGGSGTSAYPMIDPSVATIIGQLAQNLAEGVDATGNMWTVWSQVDQASTIVTNGWVDNTFDTQRRRGVEATARTTWAATFP